MMPLTILIVPIIQRSKTVLQNEGLHWVSFTSLFLLILLTLLSVLRLLGWVEGI